MKRSINLDINEIYGYLYRNDIDSVDFKLHNQAIEDLRNLNNKVHERVWENDQLETNRQPILLCSICTKPLSSKTPPCGHPNCTECLDLFLKKEDLSLSCFSCIRSSKSNSTSESSNNLVVFSSAISVSESSSYTNRSGYQNVTCQNYGNQLPRIAKPIYPERSMLRNVGNEIIHGAHKTNPSANIPFNTPRVEETKHKHTNAKKNLKELTDLHLVNPIKANELWTTKNQSIPNEYRTNPISKRKMSKKKVKALIIYRKKNLGCKNPG